MHASQKSITSVSIVSNGGLSVLSSIGETEKCRVDGDYSCVVFGKIFPGEKINVK
jgi:hypothetical protein